MSHYELSKAICGYRDVFIYCFVDEYLKSIDHKDISFSASHEPPKMSDSEILFVFIIACADYGGNYEKTLNAALRYGLIKQRLSPSQFNRRLSALMDDAFAILMFLGSIAKIGQEKFALDTFPIPICKNIRIKRNKILKTEEYRGRVESKKEWYYGFKAHLITAYEGQIIEIEFTPGSWSDQAGFNLLNFDLPEKATIFADKIYNVYDREDEINETGRTFSPIRKDNSKKEDNRYVFNLLKQLDRKHIETDISILQQAFPKTIHAVTKQGILLKLIGFCLAYNFSFYI
jgi:IS5 family transposase